MTKRLIVLILYTLILAASLTLGCEDNSINEIKQNNSTDEEDVEFKYNYSGNGSGNSISKFNNTEKSDSTKNNAKSNNINENIIDSQKQSFTRKASGEVTSVPWENDTDFIKAQEKSGAYVMLAAYCTVLPDPGPGEEENVHIGAKMLAGTVIEPGKIFSQNRNIGPYTKARGYREGPTYVGSRIITTIGGGVCKIATTLYNVAIITLADYASTTRDTDVLTEYARQSLKRAISNKFFPSNEMTSVVTLDPKVEQDIMGSVKQSEQGSYLALDPGITKEIINSVQTEVHKLEELGKNPIIITSPIVRMYFKRLTQDYFKDLVIISYNEIDSNVELQSVGMVTV
jgi:hypothetical protein